MGLNYTGTALAVNTENVSSREGKFADFLATTIVCMDGGRVTEVRAGRDFPPADVARMKDLLGKGQQPTVVLEVFASNSNGRLYAERLLSCDSPKVPAGANS